MWEKRSVWLKNTVIIFSIFLLTLFFGNLGAGFAKAQTPCPTPFAAHCGNGDCDCSENIGTCAADCTLVPKGNVQVAIKCSDLSMASTGSVNIISTDHYSFDVNSVIVPWYIYTDPDGVITVVNFNYDDIPYGDYELSTEANCGVGKILFSLSVVDPVDKVLSMVLADNFSPDTTDIDNAAPFLTCNEICHDSVPSKGCWSTTACGSAVSEPGDPITTACNYKCESRTECNCSILKLPCSVGDPNFTVASSCTGFNGTVNGVFSDSCLDSTNMIKWQCGATGFCEPNVINCIFDSNVSCTADSCSALPPPLVCPNCGLGGGVCGDCPDETYETCPQDCPFEPTPLPPPACPACGNGLCDCGETYLTCNADCFAPIDPPLSTVNVEPMDIIIGGINDWLLAIVAGLAVLMIILGGMRYAGSWGNPNEAEKAKKMIGYVIIGLVVILGSYSLVITLDKIIGGGAGAISITDTSVVPLSGDVGDPFTITATVTASLGVDDSTVKAHIQNPDDVDFVTIILLPVGGDIYSAVWIATDPGPYNVDITACDTGGNCDEANNI